MNFYYGTSSLGSTFSDFSLPRPLPKQDKTANNTPRTAHFFFEFHFDTLEETQIDLFLSLKFPLSFLGKDLAIQKERNYFPTYGLTGEVTSFDNLL